MKTLSICLVAFLFLTQQSWAQDPTEAASTEAKKIKIEVKETKERMSQGVNNCLQVYIPGADADDVTRDILKYMKNYDAKGTSKKGEIFFDNAQIKAFGNNLVDVYTNVEQKAGGTVLNVFFDLGGAYLSSGQHPDKYKEAESIVRKFGREEAAAAVGIQITNVQKTLDSQMKDLDNLVKRDSSYAKKIRDCQETIRLSEAEQQTARSDQELKKKEIMLQQQTLEGLKATQTGIE